MMEPEQLSPHLQGPLPKRGGLPTPVSPWSKAYQELLPVGHLHAAHEAWDFDFINHCLRWGGVALLQSSRLKLKEHPYFILPHFSHLEDQLTLHAGPSDAAGADALALMTGLAIETQKTLRALNTSPDAQVALEILCSLAPKKWQALATAPESIPLMDLLQALCLGTIERYVQWQPKQTSTEAIAPWLTSSKHPWYLFSGHTHRLWDGLSPLPTLFTEELLALSGDAQDVFHGLDLLKTHHPQTHKERIETEASMGIRCFGDVIGVDTALLSLQHAQHHFVLRLKNYANKKPGW